MLKNGLSRIKSMNSVYIYSKMSRIFITTSNGVFLLEDTSGNVKKVMSNRSGRLRLARAAKGFFGISLHNAADSLIASSRERFFTRKRNKPTTDTRMYSLNVSTLEYQVLFDVKNVHDAHQIARHGSYIFITDTGMNRIVVCDSSTQKRVAFLNVGATRDDINHINAVLVEGNNLLVGLNNRGATSQVLHTDLAAIKLSTQVEVNIDEYGQLQDLANVTHSHDLERVGERILCCSSHSGFVADLQTGDILISRENTWMRGLTSSERYLWVGASAIASREERHKESHDGQIHKYRLSDYSLVETFDLPGAGQVNDLVYVQ